MWDERNDAGVAVKDDDFTLELTFDSRTGGQAETQTARFTIAVAP
jgi:hypothetical protein